MSWLDKPMTGLDLETDSPNPEDARIVTACTGLASSDGWKPTTWTLKTTRPIAVEAQNIHGITTEHADRTGMDHAAGLVEIRDALRGAWQAGTPVVGWNVVYDLTVLDRELRRHNLGGLSIDGPVIDGLVLDKAVDRYRKGSRKLVDVAAHYGVELGGDAHSAEADALAACRIVWKIGRRNDGLPESADELHIFQADAYREQRLSFAEYRRKKGQPLDDGSTDWPIRPVRTQEVAA